MCGAFSVILSWGEWREVFEVDPPEHWKPLYNARPGEMLPIITEEHPKALTPAIWSYQPHWVKEPKAAGLINARAETLATKPFFRSVVEKQRCIIPADGFYEWQRKGKFKIPYRFVRLDKKPFSFAGIYDILPNAPDKRSIGFAIITTEPNSVVEPIHNRMPVMLEEGDVEQWLDSSASFTSVQPFLDPFPAELMKTFPVSRRVNYAREKGPEVIEQEKGEKAIVRGVH